MMSRNTPDVPHALKIDANTSCHTTKEKIAKCDEKSNMSVENRKKIYFASSFCSSFSV